MMNVDTRKIIWILSSRKKKSWVTFQTVTPPLSQSAWFVLRRVLLKNSSPQWSCGRKGGSLIRSEPGEITLIARLPWVKVFLVAWVVTMHVIIITCILASSVKRCIKRAVVMLGTVYLNLHWLLIALCCTRAHKWQIILWQDISGG